jgi:hypothetical protein
MLKVTYNYYGEVRTTTLDNITSYFRGKHLIFASESFKVIDKWYKFRIVLRRKSVRLEKAVGYRQDKMFDKSEFKIYSVKKV